MDSKKFYTSDLHIGHQNCIKFDNRPFSTLEEMHDTIVENWNSVVKKDDDVYILGDYAWRNEIGLEILKKLKGKKHLILGNHDKINEHMKKEFVSIEQIKIVKDGEKYVVLCHFPMAHWQGADYGYIHLFGHIHSGRDSRPFEEYRKAMIKRNIPYECYNVGCMLHNYTPVTLEQLISSDQNY